MTEERGAGTAMIAARTPPLPDVLQTSAQDEVLTKAAPGAFKPPIDLSARRSSPRPSLDEDALASLAVATIAGVINPLKKEIAELRQQIADARATRGSKKDLQVNAPPTSPRRLDGEKFLRDLEAVSRQTLEAFLEDADDATRATIRKGWNADFADWRRETRAQLSTPGSPFGFRTLH